MQKKLEAKLQNSTLLKKITNASRLKSPKARLIATLFASVIFFGGIIISHHENPLKSSNINSSYILIIVALIMPIVTLINSSRYFLTARLVDAKHSYRNAFEISVFSTIANLLPIPGGFFVKATNLKAENNTYLGSAAATFYASMLSALTTLTIATITYNEFKPSDAMLIASSIMSATLFLYLVFLSKTYQLTTAVRLICIEILSTIVDAIRILLCISIFSAVANMQQGLIMTAASVTGSAVSLIPAGLGVKEVVGAVIAENISLSGEVGFMALAANRVIGLSYFLILSLCISKKSQKKH